MAWIQGKTYRCNDLLSWTSGKLQVIQKAPADQKCGSDNEIGQLVKAKITLWNEEKMLVTIIFLFVYNVFKSLQQQSYQSWK